MRHSKAVATEQESWQWSKSRDRGDQVTQGEDGGKGRLSLPRPTACGALTLWAARGCVAKEPCEQGTVPRARVPEVGPRGPLKPRRQPPAQAAGAGARMPIRSPRLLWQLGQHCRGLGVAQPWPQLPRRGVVRDITALEFPVESEGGPSGAEDGAVAGSDLHSLSPWGQPWGPS